MRASVPARYPPTGTWPAQMRADMAAAYMDYCSKADFISAVKRGEVPRPTSMRGRGRKREPIWARADLDRYISPALDSGLSKREDSPEDLQALV